MLVALDDNEYGQNTGIICIGTIVATNQVNIFNKWIGRKTYSGNFQGHGTDAVYKPAANQPFQFRGAMPDEEAVDRVKPSYGVKRLLNEERHAEDEWFGRYLSSFEVDLQAITAALPDQAGCDDSIIEQVLAPAKVVFQITANPCLSDDRVAPKGCIDYFGELVRPIAESLPILIYWRRPYDPPVGQGRRLASIKSDGSHVIHTNSW